MMDINIFRAAVLLILMTAFIGLWIWAWSAKRKDTFADAARLPLEDDGDLNSEYAEEGRS